LRLLLQLIHFFICFSETTASVFLVTRSEFISAESNSVSFDLLLSSRNYCTILAFFGRPPKNYDHQSMGRHGSVDPPGPLFFMPNALAPWRSQNWRRRGFDASVPVPTRAEMRKEAKHEVEEPTPLAAEEPPAPAETSNPMSDGSDPEADESDASASRSKKSLAQRARDKKAAVSVPAKDGIVIGIMDLKIVKGMTVSLASYNVFTPKLGHSVWRKHSGN